MLAPDRENNDMKKGGDINVIRYRDSGDNDMGILYINIQ
tara:strand:+ start:91 stop:207 length:117 start_codon:yes stop_codon:yes gene_type:complete